MTSPGTARPDASGGDGANRRVVTLDVYSDYTCPWCYVGWARLEQALEAMDDAAEVDVTWRPFEIHPDVPVAGMPVSELGYPEEQWERMQEAQAEDPEHFPRFHEALFVGYFGEGRDLGDPEVIRELAEGAGLDAVAMEEALEDGRYEAVLEATTARARALGISGTPTFVFDEKFAAVGAQPPEVLVRAFTAAVEAGA